MLAIYKRDILSYFRTISGYAYFAAALMVCGYFFTLENVINGSGELTAMYSAMGAAMIMLVPFVTVRVFIDGREVNAEQMLYVSPVRIVLAKFLAVMSIMVAAVTVTWLYVGILLVYTSPSLPEIILCQVGIVLVCGALTAMVMFILSIAHRKMQAFVMIYTLILVFFVVNDLMQTAAQPIYEEVLGLLNLFGAYSKFLTGILSPAGLIYLLVFTGAFLLLTCAMLDRKKDKGV